MQFDCSFLGLILLRQLILMATLRLNVHVARLKFVVKAKHIKNVGKVLHKLFKIDFSVAINVSIHRHCDNLLLCKGHSAFVQACRVLTEVKGAILVSVILLKSSEQLNCIKLQGLFVNCIFFGDLAELNSLVFLQKRPEHEFFTNDPKTIGQEFFVIEEAIFVRVAITEQNVGLEWSDAQHFAASNTLTCIVDVHDTRSLFVDLMKLSAYFFDQIVSVIGHNLRLCNNKPCIIHH